MPKKILIEKLIEQSGGRFSTSLGIDVSYLRSQEIFKWFLASILFGARISETIAVNTYREFENAGILSPNRIQETGWDGLVKILDDGGYVRYDFKTATKLLEIMKTLQDEYGGDLSKLHEAASGPRDLEKKLRALGRGIGEVTTNIFLRELRGLWKKAEPLPGKLVLTATRNLGLISGKGLSKQEALEALKYVWEKEGVQGKEFADFESALVRLGKDWCRKGRCKECMVRSYCQVK